ncbi:MAG TPA: hypothetical protein VK530_17250, partial [Candidatus Acidoferrum sp.]|nr:hypothetical protein [Candidatus Acidoferrum sp.]
MNNLMLVGRNVLAAPRTRRIAPVIHAGLRTARPTLLVIIFAVLVFAMFPLAFRATNIAEDFSTDPLGGGWRVHGDTSLFQWNATNQSMDVTWDSSQTNSYFWLPLRTVLSRSDDFSLGFDLTLRDIAVGTSSGRPYTFEIAIGFLNFSNAMKTNFYRGAGQSALGPRNLVEFTYFPDSGFGATFAPTIATTNNQILVSHNHPIEMTTDDLFHIEMNFTSTNRTLRTVVTKNGASFSPMDDVVLGAASDFRCDALAIMSYSDVIQFGEPQFWGSVLAHGVVDNLVASIPESPLYNFTGTRSNQTWRAEFLSRTNWSYVLERTHDLVTWTNVSVPVAGNG